jgi:UDP-N-acetylmuramoyl-L-alanyl-D-glutamate--2,6-diaminopimelate ligase
VTSPADLAQVIRPTPAPFDWAEPFFCLGVTGTNGKTSTTMLAADALRAGGHRVLVETTIGYDLDGAELDVPRTHAGYIQAFERAAGAGCRHACIELTSEALARGYAKRWRFDLGVFTNLTRDHLESHLSFEHYLASKAQLFVHLAPGRIAVFNACDEASLLLDRVTPKDVVRRWFAVPSRGAPLHDADLSAERVELGPDGTRVLLRPSPLAEALGGALETRLVGEVFAENALAAALAALGAGVAAADVRRGIAQSAGPRGRFEIVHRSPLVAIDYAHTPDALARTCATARALAGTGKVLVVFGAGGRFDPGKREPMGRSVGASADVAIVTTDNPRDEDPAEIAKAVAAGCRRGGRAYVMLEPDRRRAIAKALERARPGDVIVIAGKGHEREQVVGERKISVSDASLVSELVGK